MLAAVVLGALWLERAHRVFRALGAALVAILLGMLLSNVGVLPGVSPVYDGLASIGVQLGIVLILLSVDVRTVVRAGPRMLVAFGIGAAGTVVGASTAAWLLGDAIGPETWKLAGQYTATYIGGGMNFAALGRAFETSPDLFSAAVAADVGLTAVWMAICLAAPLAFGRGGQTGSEPGGEAQATGGIERALFESRRPITLTDLAALAAIAVATMWAAGALEAVTGGPSILWLTTVALAAAQLPAVRGITGAAVLGNYFVILFLAANGAQSVLANILAVGPAIAYFALITVGLHGVILFGVGLVLRIDLGTLAVASQANVGGSSSAMAMASARGYADRLLPGIAVGLLGTALGNYVGFGVATLFR